MPRSSVLAELRFGVLEERTVRRARRRVHQDVDLAERLLRRGGELGRAGRRVDRDRPRLDDAGPRLAVPSAVLRARSDSPASRAETRRRPRLRIARAMTCPNCEVAAVTTADLFASFTFSPWRLRHAAHLFFEQVPDLLAVMYEFRTRLDLLVVGPAPFGEIDLDRAEDLARMRAENHDAVGEKHRLVDAVRDEDDRTLLAPRAT